MRIEKPAEVASVIIRDDPVAHCPITTIDRFVSAGRDMRTRKQWKSAGVTVTGLTQGESVPIGDGAEVFFPKEATDATTAIDYTKVLAWIPKSNSIVVRDSNPRADLFNQLMVNAAPKKQVAKRSLPNRKPRALPKGYIKIPSAYWEFTMLVVRNGVAYVDVPYVKPSTLSHQKSIVPRMWLAVQSTLPDGVFKFDLISEYRSVFAKGTVLEIRKGQIKNDAPRELLSYGACIAKEIELPERLQREFTAQDEAITLTLKQSRVLLNAIQSVACHMGTDETRYFLQLVNIQDREVVATNGRSLGISQLPDDFPDITIKIRDKVVKHLVSIKNLDTPIVIDNTTPTILHIDGVIHVDIDSYDTLGQFPNYHRVIPDISTKYHQSTATIDQLKEVFGGFTKTTGSGIRAVLDTRDKDAVYLNVLKMYYRKGEKRKVLPTRPVNLSWMPRNCRIAIASNLFVPLLRHLKNHKITDVQTYVCTEKNKYGDCSHAMVFAWNNTQAVIMPMQCD